MLTLFNLIPFLPRLPAKRTSFKLSAAPSKLSGNKIEATPQRNCQPQTCIQANRAITDTKGQSIRANATMACRSTNERGPEGSGCYNICCRLSEERRGGTAKDGHVDGVNHIPLNVE